MDSLSSLPIGLWPVAWLSRKYCCREGNSNIEGFVFRLQMEIRSWHLLNALYVLQDPQIQLSAPGKEGRIWRRKMGLWPGWALRSKSMISTEPSGWRRGLVTGDELLLIISSRIDLINQRYMADVCKLTFTPIAREAFQNELKLRFLIIIKY